MIKTMRTLYAALVAVVILGTVVYAQETPKTGTSEEKKALPNATPNTPNLVRSLNTLQGDLTLVSGPNISITPSGNLLTIAAANALTGVAHDNTLTGNGTAASPLGVASQDKAVDFFNEQNAKFFGAGSNLLLVNFSVVPAGKQLIVQHLSVFCPLENTVHGVVGSLEANARGHFFFTTHQMAGDDSKRYHLASHPVTMYVNSGHALSALIQRNGPGGNTTDSCSVSVSGRFVPAVQ